MSIPNFSWQFDPRALLSRDRESEIITSIIDIVKNSVFPENSGYSSAHLTSVRSSKDIHEFPELIAYAINKRQEYEGISEIDRIDFRQSMVDLTNERDVIVWELDSRKPGLMAAGKPGNTHVQEYTRHPRAAYPDPFEPNHSIIAHGQFMDNWLRLKVYSTDAQTANRRAIWLEDLMEEFKWYFFWQGINRILFHEREKDCFEEYNGNKFHCRSLMFFVRTERILLTREAILKNVAMELSIINPQNKGLSKAVI